MSDQPTNRKAVGIDLGTTFCAIAHIDAYGKPQIVPNAESERITPSGLPPNFDPLAMRVFRVFRVLYCWFVVRGKGRCLAAAGA